MSRSLGRYNSFVRPSGLWVTLSCAGPFLPLWWTLRASRQRCRTVSSPYLFQSLVVQLGPPSSRSTLNKLMIFLLSVAGSSQIRVEPLPEGSKDPSLCSSFLLCSWASVAALDFRQAAVLPHTSPESVSWETRSIWNRGTTGTSPRRCFITPWRSAGRTRRAFIGRW